MPSFKIFISLPPPHPCSPPSVFDYAYTNADTHQTNNKLVFVSWWEEGVRCVWGEEWGGRGEAYRISAYG